MRSAECGGSSGSAGGAVGGGPAASRVRPDRRTLSSRRHPGSRGGAARVGARLLTALAALAVAAPVAATPVLPGQAFEVRFTFEDPPQSALGDVDVLTFGLSGSSSATGVLGYDVELWDGSTLLGSRTSNGLELWAFTAAESLWTENAHVVDLASVADGSIDGRLRVVPQFDPGAPAPQLDAVFFPATGLVVGTGLPSPTGNSLATSTPVPSVGLTGAVVVPEPALATLGLAVALGPGLAAPGGGLRRLGRRSGAV